MDLRLLGGRQGHSTAIGLGCCPLLQLHGSWTELRAVAVMRPSASLSPPVWLGGRWRLMEYRNFARVLGGPAGGRPLGMDGAADADGGSEQAPPHCDCASDSSWQR